MSAKVRDAFLDQARWCDQLDSPFTARLCRLFAENLRPLTPLASTILDWPGDPTAKADSVPLRITGALHYLVITGLAPRLQALYPPGTSGDDALWAAIEAALGAHEAVVRRHLASPPQTNEVMRSAALLPGLLEAAQRCGLPLSLYELGASAGLNLILDRYRYQFGNATWGDPASPLEIAPEWHGPLPPVQASLVIQARRGVDLNPIDLREQGVRQRLLSYVWADQFARQQRLGSAISIWLRDPPQIERADAAAWLESCGIGHPAPGVARVLFHSIAWSYFPPAACQRISQRMQEYAAQATPSSPLAWLQYELAGNAAALTLQMWPGGKTVTLATGHPHGASLKWGPG